MLSKLSDEPVVCAHPKCDKKFIATRSNQTFCPQHRRQPNADLTRPVRCAKCGEKFTRTHGKQKFCPKCRPARVNARSAARAAARPARLEANRQNRKETWVSPKYISQPRLARWFEQPCPHKVPIGECTEGWCRNRVAEMRKGYVRPVKSARRPRGGYAEDD